MGWCRVLSRVGETEGLCWSSQHSQPLWVIQDWAKLSINPYGLRIVSYSLCTFFHIIISPHLTFCQRWIQVINSIQEKGKRAQSSSFHPGIVILYQLFWFRNPHTFITITLIFPPEMRSTGSNYFSSLCELNLSLLCAEVMVFNLIITDEQSAGFVIRLWLKICIKRNSYSVDFCHWSF